MQKFPWMAAITVGALCFLSVLYGSLAVHMNWWPAATVRDAKLAFEALSEVADEELRKKWPASMESAATEADAPVVKSYVNGLPDDIIFVDGGAQQLRSHCPVNGCIAWLMNRAGDILHVWDVGPDLIWADLESVEGFNRPENIYSVGAWPLPDGDLLVVYQGRNTYPYGIGIARFDRNSKLLWKRENFSHHWLSVDADGFIYTSAFQPLTMPAQVGDLNLQLNCRGGILYEDVILVLDPNGNEVERVRLLDVLTESGYAGLVFQDNHSDHPLPIEYDECDPTHLNDVQVVSAADAAGSDLLDTGDLLISMRSLNAIALIDRATWKTKWVSAGRVVLQHSPRYLGDESVLVFDNLGGRKRQGGSRVARIDMRTNEATSVYPPPDLATDFLSATAGYIDVSDDRQRALVSLTRQGRTVEIDLQTGDLLWEYLNIHDVSGLARDENGAGITGGRFATQTVRYFNAASFPFNGGRPDTAP